jgi:hypothetical protein
MNILSVDRSTCESSPDDLHSVIRPQGNFRFLSPMDIVARGDFFRVCPQDGKQDREAPFNYNYSPVGYHQIGKSIRELAQNSWEFIRPIPDESITVPLFDIED